MEPVRVRDILHLFDAAATGDGIGVTFDRDEDTLNVQTDDAVFTFPPDTTVDHIFRCAMDARERNLAISKGEKND